MFVLQYEDAAVVMLAYSVSSKESLQSVNKWYSAVKASLSAHYKNPIGVVVGCKSDVRDGSVDSRAEVSMVEVRMCMILLDWFGKRRTCCWFLWLGSFFIYLSINFLLLLLIPILIFFGFIFYFSGPDDGVGIEHGLLRDECGAERRCRRRLSSRRRTIPQEVRLNSHQYICLYIIYICWNRLCCEHWLIFLLFALRFFFFFFLF